MTPAPSASIEVEVGRMQERMSGLSREVIDGHARIDRNIEGLGIKLDKLVDIFVGRPEFEGSKKSRLAKLAGLLFVPEP